MPAGSKAHSNKPLLWVNRDLSSSHTGIDKHNKEVSTILSHVQRRRRETERIKAGREAPWSRLTSCWPVGVDEAETRLPRSYPSDNGSDPFNATAVGADARHHIILEVTFSQRTQVVFLAEAFASHPAMRQGFSRRHDRVIAERLRRCVEDEMVMYSTMAVGHPKVGNQTGQGA